MSSKSENLRMPASQTKEQGSQGKTRIDSFLQSVRRRLGLQYLLHVLVWTILIAGSVMLLVALSYVLRGHAVDRQWYLYVAGLGAAAALAAGALHRRSLEGAASFADRFFGLKDLLITFLHADRTGHRGGYYALQAEQAAKRVASIDPQAIDCRPPRRQMWLAIGLASLSVLLALKQPSAAIQQQLDLEATVLGETQRMNDELEELVQELEQQDEAAEEHELVDPDKLRKLVEELRETNDHKEALRQYARLEQQLEKTRHKLSQRRDEQLLARAAKELEQGRETKPLAKQLQQKKFEQAGEQLQKWKPKETKPWDQQRRDLARLKAAAQRMAAAARSGKQGSTSAQNPNSTSKKTAASSKTGSSKGGSGQASGSASSEGGGELEQAIEQLAQSLNEWDEALEKAEKQVKRSGKCDSESESQCQACSNCAESDLDKLSKYLRKMTIKRRVDQKLSKLCKACSQCQSSLSQCAACNSPKAGGKKAGWGSNTARRDEHEELIDNGQTESLTGVKGQGPSQTAVESADEGTGVATRGATERVRKFQRQYESFVSREDVPAEVKTGVKRYFQFIHQIDETKPTEQDTP